MAKEKKSKLSRRITWSVIGIMVFFNGLIIFAIHMFVYDVSVLLGNSRGQYVIDGIGGKMETMLNVVERMVVNGRAEVEENLDSFVAPIFDYQNHKVGVFGIDLDDSWIDIVIQNAIENVRKEFLENKESTDPYEEILFSIQVLDSKGNRIAGSDSLDLAILQNDQKQVHADFEYKNIMR